MARPKKSAPKPIEPEDASQEVPDEEPAVVIEPDTPTISKAEAVRAALSAGKESPGDIHDFILKKFGHDIPNQMISSYKAQEKARQEKKKATATSQAEPAKRGRKPKATAPVANGYAAPPEKPMAAGEPDLLLALEGVKELVGQFGADRVKRMVDIIG
jgi:hypothetical protein